MAKDPTGVVGNKVFWVRPFISPPPTAPEYQWNNAISTRPIVGWMQVRVEAWASDADVSAFEQKHWPVKTLLGEKK